MTIRVGLVGLGEVAQLMHLPLLADDTRFAITAVMDVAPSLVDHVAGRYGVRHGFTEPGALMACPEVDAVFILAPDQVHAPLLAAAIGAGKHVFLEKPAALAAEELAPILPRLAGLQTVVFVGYMRRYARGFTTLKERLPALSDIRHVRVRDIICEAPFFVRQTRPVFVPKDVPAAVIAEGRAETERLLRLVAGADAPADLLRAYQVLTGLSSHSLSAMRDLLGDPVRVVAARQHRGETLMALFDYGHFTAVYEAHIGNVAAFDAGFEVLTDRERYRLSYDTPYIRNLPTRLEITRSSDTQTGTEIVGPIYEDPFRLELDAFHAAVTAGAPVRTTLADAVEDLALFKAVVDAMKR